MTDVDAAAHALASTGLPYNPPEVLITRWAALVAGDSLLYLDAAFESGARVPGTRYAFVAVSDGAVCYLEATHDDEGWDQQRVGFHATGESLTPRTLVAWRRPLTLVTEVGLGGDAWHWLPTRKGDRPSDSYVLKFGTDVIHLPLQGPHRSLPAPDPRPVIARLSEVWRLRAS